MTEKITISQGDSFSFAVVLPPDKMPQVEEVVVYVGNKAVARKSDSSLLATVDANTFHVRLSSTFVQSLSGQYNIIVAVDYSDLGIKKVSTDDALILVVKNNNNQFSNSSVSDAISATITIIVIDDEITQDTTIATVSRGYSALELYRIENNDNTLTLEDMLEEQNKLPYRVVQIVNITDGSVIEHNLGGVVLCQVVESGQIQGGVWGEYFDENKVTIRTPFFEDLLNKTYTGYAIITLLEDVYSRTKVINVTDIQDGDVVTHNLNGSVLMQYIETGQIQGGFFGQFSNQNSVFFKTPSLEGQTFTGQILCTKLS